MSGLNRRRVRLAQRFRRDRPLGLHPSGRNVVRRRPDASDVIARVSKPHEPLVAMARQQRVHVGLGTARAPIEVALGEGKEECRKTEACRLAIPHRTARCRSVRRCSRASGPKECAHDQINPRFEAPGRRRFPACRREAIDPEHMRQPAKAVGAMRQLSPAARA